MWFGAEHPERGLLRIEVVPAAPSLVFERAGTPQSTAEFIRSERERWGRIIREVGIEPE